MTDHQIILAIAIVAVVCLFNGWHYGFGPFQRTSISPVAFNPLPGLLSLVLAVVVALFFFNVLSGVFAGAGGLLLFLVLVILLVR